MLASLLGPILLPPIVQNQNYHDFADQRTLFGIPHFWNVVSNIPFLGIGAAGLWQFDRSSVPVRPFLLNTPTWRLRLEECIFALL
jgi:hypothetical protein